MKQRMLAWWGDIRSGDLNPVMVRELRQYLRSRFANLVVILMLAGLVLITMGFFAEARSRVTVSGVEIAAGSGMAMFAAVSGVLSMAAVLLALYTAQRMGLERERQNPDLLFTTVLRPGQVARGKLMAGLAMFGFFLSLAMPFMTMTYMMRGIDVRVILWGLFSLSVGSVLLLGGAILLGCLPLGPVFRRGGIAVVVMLFWVLPAGLSLFGAIFSPMGRASFSWGTWGWWQTAGLAILIVIGVLLPYATSVLLLSPPRSNRFLPFRLTLTGIWLAGLMALMVGMFVHGTVSDELLALWVMPGTWLLLLLVQISECMADIPSYRTLRRVPRSFLGRVVAFPFFTGGVQGTVWALVLLLGYAGSAMLLDPDVWLNRGPRNFAITMLYALCYILTARLISRRLPESVRQGAGTPWLLTLYMAAAAALLPTVLDIMRENRTISFHAEVEPGNLFAMFREQSGYWEVHAIAGGAWLGLVLLLNLPRLLAAFAAFRRPPEEAAETQP